MTPGAHDGASETPAFLDPLRAFLDEVLDEDLCGIRVMEPADEDHDTFYRDVYHYLRDDIAEHSVGDDEDCVGRRLLEERWTGDDPSYTIEYSVQSHEEIDLVMVFEGGRRATAITFTTGTAHDLPSFADHVHDIVMKEASTGR